ncbi:MAG: hypothetical protein ACRDZR_14170, partial [Acidimicrobiales bacterium]
MTPRVLVLAWPTGTGWWAAVSTAPSGPLPPDGDEAAGAAAPDGDEVDGDEVDGAVGAAEADPATPVVTTASSAAASAATGAVPGRRGARHLPGSRRTRPRAPAPSGTASLPGNGRGVERPGR